MKKKKTKREQIIPRIKRLKNGRVKMVLMISKDATYKDVEAAWPLIQRIQRITQKLNDQA